MEQVRGCRGRRGHSGAGGRGLAPCSGLLRTVQASPSVYSSVKWGNRPTVLSSLSYHALPLPPQNGDASLWGEEKASEVRTGRPRAVSPPGACDPGP